MIRAIVIVTFKFMVFFIILNRPNLVKIELFLLRDLFNCKPRLPYLNPLGIFHILEANRNLFLVNESLIPQDDFSDLFVRVYSLAVFGVIVTPFKLRLLVARFFVATRHHVTAPVRA